jgi:hypothetical protein
MNFGGGGRAQSSEKKEIESLVVGGAGHGESTC